ncbi:MAG: hypothetical protein WB902_33420, partial [Acetobacteraceae bacterium]
MALLPRSVGRSPTGGQCDANQAARHCRGMDRMHPEVLGSVHDAAFPLARLDALVGADSTARTASA